MNSDKTQLNILVINYDLRNEFENNFAQIYKKLERDHLNPEINNFHFISWSQKNYTKKIGKFSTTHLLSRRWWSKFLTDFFWSLIFVVKAAVQAKFKPDIILVYDFGFLPTARIIKKLLGGKIVLCLTNMPRFCSSTRSFGHLRSFYNYLLEKSFVGLVDKFYTINQVTKKYLTDIGVKPEKISIFSSNIIAQDKQIIIDSQVGQIRQKFNIGDDKKIFLSVGRLVTEKNFPRLLKIFSKLRDDLVLIILGDGEQQVYLENLTDELKLKDRVIFAGFVSREEIWNYYHDASAFILLSESEALGLVFWEAMYMKVPVIGSTAPGIVETIGKNADRGMLLQNGDNIEAVREKIDFCLTESPDRESMLLRAKEFVETQMSMKTNINNI